MHRLSILLTEVPEKKKKVARNLQEKILKSDEILDNPASSHHQKDKIYPGKYLMYKRLFNYAEAKNNLPKAKKEASFPVIRHPRQGAKPHDLPRFPKGK